MALEQWKNLYNEVDIVRKFTYMDDRIGTGEGCEVAMTARTKCGRVMFRECDELLDGQKFLVRLKGAAYHSYVTPAQ